MSRLRLALRSAIALSAIGILALVSAQPSSAAQVRIDKMQMQSDGRPEIMRTRVKLGDGPVVRNAANSAAGRDIVLYTRGFAAVGRVLIGFTAANLNPFYTLPGDCNADCLTKWRPVPASAQA